MDNLFSLHPSPVFLRREALDAGYRDADLRQAARAGVIKRIRHGAYVDHAAWVRASGEERHLLLADAVVLSHEAPLALSHVSAAVAHGFRTYRANLSQVHMLCLDEPVGRTHADVVYHQTSPRTLDAMAQVSNRVTVPPARAALEAASMTGVRDGLVVLDSALNLGLVTVDQMKEEFARIEGRPGSQSLRVAVSLARGFGVGRRDSGSVPDVAPSHSGADSSTRGSR